MTDTNVKSVASVDRALAILLAFSRDTPRLNLTQLAEAAGLYKSTVSRLALSFEKAHLLVRNDGGTYSIGPGAMRLAQAFQEAIEPGDVIMPVLEKLVAVTGESACFHVRSGSERVCLFRVESPQRVRYHVRVGDIIPLSQGAAGHILLAFSNAKGRKYEAIRKAGYAITVGEVTPDTAALAVPVFGLAGELLGALSLSGPLTRVNEKSLLKWRGLILELSRGLEITSLAA